MRRQIVLDTETTGLEPAEGHRIIEIGCLELVNRRLTGRKFHQYLNPEREIDRAAEDVHGLSNTFLADKPRFAEVAAEFLEFVQGAELVIHNAAFDLGFLDAELARLAPPGPTMGEICGVLDTLMLARQLHPGQRNSLDALCKRFAIDNSNRELHGALLDAQLLADVYLVMTGGQAELVLGAEESTAAGTGRRKPKQVRRKGLKLVVQRASEEELAAHEAALDRLDQAVGGPCIWRQATSEVPVEP
ncbi:DNA polymerase III subunit epsilon [Thioalkalivibrio sp. XN279]|uniref:DNA polymerase III subunit epsilon n=1 Tax=Thioalkalivibrio sp. XN279 TaxID=2714953 RepID=UPI0014095171|nr:DNA polymerase III subunit epsilon [Thioalkalivibrio sp. XN279]NHA15486.1 DNA polymerase III subunit epsilon [Thioalkalivibrio sp. XN279]